MRLQPLTARCGGRWRAAPLILAGIVHQTPCPAFDSAEHCGVANLAARLAFDYVEADIGRDLGTGDVPLQSLRKARSLLLPDAAGVDAAGGGEPADGGHPGDNRCSPDQWPFHIAAVPLSYGKIVAMVDYALNPQDLFLSTGISERIPASEDDLNPDYFGSHNFVLLLRSFLASHNNFRHFQSPSIESFYQLHGEAMTAAIEPEGMPDARLFRALVLNAAADHFLAELFAPGHLITPRDRMYDAIAMSWHDGFNYRGRMLATRHWEELAPLFEYAVTRAHGTDGLRLSYDEQFQEIGDSNSGRNRRDTFAAALAELARRRDPKAVCPLHRSVLERVTDPMAARFTRMLDINGTLLSNWPSQAAWSADGQLFFCVHGDGALDQHDSFTSADVEAQKAFMVLVDAKYIVDLLEAYLQKTQRRQAGDTFHAWCPAMRGGWTDQRTNKPCDLLMQQATSLCAGHEADHACRKVYMIPTVVTEYFAFLSTPQDGNKLDLGVTDSADYLYALHLGATQAHHYSAAVGGVELGFAPHEIAYQPTKHNFGSQIASVETAAFVGVEWRGAAPYSSHAFTLRGLLELPQIDIGAGPYVDMIKLDNGVTTRYRWSCGGRFEFGFSNLSLYLAAGDEPALNNPLHTTHGFGITTGITGVLNGRRLWNDVSGLFPGG